MNLKDCLLKMAGQEDITAELYHEFSKKCSERLKPVLITFAKEEERHKSVIIELAEHEQFNIRELDEEERVLFLKISDGSNAKCDRLDLSLEKDFFKYALQVEKDSIEIYKYLMKLFPPDSDGHGKLEEMIAVERRHMLYILNKLHDLQ